MFAKLVVLILSVGIGASVLLVVRHAQTQAAHELAAARLRIVDLDARLWRIRAEIAGRVTPEAVHEMSEELAGVIGPLGPASPPQVTRHAAADPAGVEPARGP